MDTPSFSVEFINHYGSNSRPSDASKLKPLTSEAGTSPAPEPTIYYMCSPFCGTAKEGRRQRGAGGLALALSEEAEIDG